MHCRYHAAQHSGTERHGAAGGAGTSSAAMRASAGVRSVRLNKLVGRWKCNAVQRACGTCSRSHSGGAPALATRPHTRDVHRSPAPVRHSTVHKSTNRVPVADPREHQRRIDRHVARIAVEVPPAVHEASLAPRRRTVRGAEIKAAAGGGGPRRERPRLGPAPDARSTRRPCAECVAGPVNAPTRATAARHTSSSVSWILNQCSSCDLPQSPMYLPISALRDVTAEPT